MDKIVKKLMYGPLSPIAVWAFRFISDTEYLYFFIGKCMIEEI